MLIPIMAGKRLPLDVYKSAGLVIWDYAKRVSSYNGPCVRVRRSLDNAEMDFGFRNNYINYPCILDFCGAGNGFVVKAYSQYGTNHLTQSGAGNQPRIVNAGTFESTGLYFDDSSYLLNLSAMPLFSSFTMLSNVKIASASAARYVVHLRNAASTRELSLLYGYVGSTFELFGGSAWAFRADSQILANDSLNHLITYSYDGATGDFKGYRDTTKVVDVTKTAGIIDSTLLGFVGGQEGWSTLCNMKSFMMFNKVIPSQVLAKL